MDANRVAEIERELADLGDTTGWRGEIYSETGDLILRLPKQFSRQVELGHDPDLYVLSAMWLANIEDSTQADHALLNFLGDAPHAIAELLEENSKLRAVCEQIVRECYFCEQSGIVEIIPAGLDAWLPTGDPNIQDAPCGYCGPARAALEQEANNGE